MLTSLVLLLVVRVAWAKPGKLGWKYNSVPQCPPVSRALCAGLWLILVIATFYSARSAGRQQGPGPCFYAGGGCWLERAGVSRCRHFQRCVAHLCYPFIL